MTTSIKMSSASTKCHYNAGDLITAPVGSGWCLWSMCQN